MDFKKIFLLQLFIHSYQIQCGNSISNSQEYLVQIPENWIEEIKNESLNFGFIFREKIISNVFLFQDDTTWANNTDFYKNTTFDKIAHFNDVFAGKIIKIEPRKHSIVKFRPPRKETWVTCCTESEEPEQPKTCGDYYGTGVSTAWSLGYTGDGIRVAVVDNGVNDLHPDLVNHVDKRLSHSFVDEDPKKITPQRFYNYLKETDEVTSHGTMAAGLIAGEFGNNVCSSGIAHGALIVALKVFATEKKTLDWIIDGFSYSDDHVTPALKYERGIIDIYSCSFNRDNPFTALSLDTKTVLEDGVRAGREGKGNIFVFSAGNSGGQVCDCNMEAFASNEHTITIASVGKEGNVPSYAIPCASILASTYGEYTTYNGSCKLKVTAHNRTCHEFNGTSASAAFASGVIGLALQANYNLTWRCVQHIIALTSSFDELQADRLRIYTNAAEFKFERHFGFGLMNTTAMILLAKTWSRVPEQYVSTIYELDSSTRYLSNDKVAGFLNLECSSGDNCVTFIEHVLVDMSYNTSEEEKLNIVLCSPRKTCSYLLKSIQTERICSYETMEINRRWTFKTVNFWGENPRGTWKIILFSRHSIQLNSVSINVHGTTMYPYPSITNVAYFKRNISNITTDHALYDFLTKEIPDIFPNSTNIDNGLSSFNFNNLLSLISIIPILGFVYCLCKLPKRTKNIDDSNSLSINDGSITVSSKVYLVDCPSATGKIYSEKAKDNFCTCNVAKTEESSESFI